MLLLTSVAAAPRVAAAVLVAACVVGGDCVSGSHHIGQNFFFRPFPGWSRYRTPIGSLYMVGAATWPGGGINGGSGYLLARQLLNNPMRLS